MLYIIDGSSLLTTMFYANLPKEILFAKETSEKEKYYYKILKLKTAYILMPFWLFSGLFLRYLETRGQSILLYAGIFQGNFQKKLYGEYKANRSETPEPLKSQFALCQEMLDKMGIKQFMSSEFEADDFCGSLSAKFEGLCSGWHNDKG